MQPAFPDGADHISNMTRVQRAERDVLQWRSDSRTAGRLPSDIGIGTPSSAHLSEHSGCAWRTGSRSSRATPAVMASLDLAAWQPVRFSALNGAEERTRTNGSAWCEQAGLGLP